MIAPPVEVTLTAPSASMTLTLIVLPASIVTAPLFPTPSREVTDLPSAIVMVPVDPLASTVINPPAEDMFSLNVTLLLAD